MTRAYAIGAVAGLAVGAVVGYLLGAAVGLTAMALVAYQDTPPDYAYLPFVAGLVLGPVLAVLRVRRRHMARDT